MTPTSELQAEAPSTFAPEPQPLEQRRSRIGIIAGCIVLGVVSAHVAWFLGESHAEPVFLGVLALGSLVACVGSVLLFRELHRLRRDHTWLLSSLDQLPLGFNIKAKTGNYLLVNAEFARRYGLSKKDIVGRANETLFPDSIESNQRAREQEAALVTSGVGEQRLQTKTWSDGTQRSLLITKFPIFDRRGAVTAIGSLGFDVTEQERARRLERELSEKTYRESTLLETKQQLETAVAQQTKALRDANMVLQQRLDLIEALSEQVEHTTGQEFMQALVLRLAEIMPADTVFVGRLTEDEAHVQTVAVCRDGVPGAPFSYALAGSPCEIVMRGQPSVYTHGVAELFPDDPPLANNGIQGYVGNALRDHQGKPFGIIVALSKRPIADADFAARAVRLFADRTAAELERMDTDAALRALNAELEQRVAERTRDLSEAHARSEKTLEELHTTQGELVRVEKLAALGALVAGVAHEINTPLGNALMASTALSDHNAAIARDIQQDRVKKSALIELTTASGQACQHVIDNLKRVARLVERFKRVATDTRSLERRRFSLCDPINGTLKLMESQFAVPGCEVVTDVPEEIALDSFPGAIDQILIHLLENALAHGIAGNAGGVITIAARESEPGMARLTVRDNGRGIAPENLEKVFEPFFTTARGRGKVGLGLHIVHNIVVNTLAGSIQVGSTPDAFTEFVVTFPLTAPQALERPAA